MLGVILAAALLGQTRTGVVEKSYDKFSDETSLNMRLGDVFKDDLSGVIEFNLGTYSDKDKNFVPLKLQDKVMLLFFSSSKSWRFLNNRHVIGMIDGKQRIDLGEPPHRGKMSTSSTFHVLESVITRISLADLERMSLGHEVEFQINTTEFKLSPEQIGMMKEFVARMKLSDAEYDALTAKKEQVKRVATAAKVKADQEVREKQAKEDVAAQEAYEALAEKVRTNMTAALKKAKVKAGTADLSNRSRALARETEKAKIEVCEKFKISRAELSKMTGGK